MATVFMTLRMLGQRGVSSVLTVLDQHSGGDVSQTLSDGFMAHITSGGCLSQKALNFVMILYLGGASNPVDWNVETEADDWANSEWFGDHVFLREMMHSVNAARQWLGNDCLSWVDILHGTYVLRCGLTVSEAYLAGCAINTVDNAFKLLERESNLDERDVGSVSAAPRAGVSYGVSLGGGASGMTYTLPSVTSPSVSRSTLVYKPGILSKAIVMETFNMKLPDDLAGLLILRRATEPSSFELGCSPGCESQLWGLFGQLDPSCELSRSVHTPGPKVEVKNGDFVVQSQRLMWASRIFLVCSVACLVWMCTAGGDLLSAGVAGLISIVVAGISAVVERGRVFDAIMYGKQACPGGIGVLGDTIDDVVVSAYRMGLNPFSENTCWAGSRGTGDVRCDGLSLEKLSSTEFHRGGVLIGSDNQLYAIPQGPGLKHCVRVRPFTQWPDVLPDRVGGVSSKM